MWYDKGVRRSEAATASETMPKPAIDERYEALSARLRDALRNRQRVRDVMTDDELQEMQERRQAYSEALDQYNQELRESIRSKREAFKQGALKQAERDGVDLPEAVAGDYSPTGQALRCQFYRVACPDDYYRWDFFQRRWFAHPRFDQAEYDRLLSLYNLS